MTKWLEIIVIWLIPFQCFAQIQLDEIDLEHINSNPVIWSNTAFEEKPDSIIHFYDSNSSGMNETNFSFNEEVQNIFKNDTAPSIEQLKQFYPFNYSYKTDSAKNIIGNTAPYDSCESVIVNRCPAVYRDFLVFYKNGKVTQYLAVCTHCTHILSLPNKHHINCLANNGEFLFYISLYGRGYTFLGNKFR
jgi:hypothetical protein